MPLRTIFGKGASSSAEACENKMEQNGKSIITAGRNGWSHLETGNVLAHQISCGNCCLTRQLLAHLVTHGHIGLHLVTSAELQRSMKM